MFCALLLPRVFSAHCLYPPDLSWFSFSSLGHSSSSLSPAFCFFLFCITSSPVVSFSFPVAAVSPCPFWGLTFPGHTGPKGPNVQQLSANLDCLSHLYFTSVWPCRRMPHLDPPQFLAAGFWSSALLSGSLQLRKRVVPKHIPFVVAFHCLHCLLQPSDLIHWEHPLCAFLPLVHTHPKKS